MIPCKYTQLHKCVLEKDYGWYYARYTDEKLARAWTVGARLAHGCYCFWG
jgi:hypothetical protein